MECYWLVAECIKLTGVCLRVCLIDVYSTSLLLFVPQRQGGGFAQSTSTDPLTAPSSREPQSPEVVASVPGGGGSTAAGITWRRSAGRQRRGSLYDPLAADCRHTRCP